MYMPNIAVIVSGVVSTYRYLKELRVSLNFTKHFFFKLFLDTEMIFQLIEVSCKLQLWHISPAEAMCGSSSSLNSLSSTEASDHMTFTMGALEEENEGKAFEDFSSKDHVPNRNSKSVD